MFGDGEGGDAAIYMGFNEEVGVIKIIGGNIASVENLFGICVG